MTAEVNVLRFRIAEDQRRGGQWRIPVVVGCRVGWWSPLVKLILDRRQPSQDLGGDWFEQRRSTRNHIRRLVAQLEPLGHTVTLEPATAAQLHP